MEKISLKMRCIGFSFIVFLLIPLCIFIMYISVDELRSWSEFPDILVFSSLSIAAGVIAPLFLITFVIISIQPIFKGRRASIMLQTICSKVLYLLLIIGLVVNFGFNYYYTGKLVEQGYIKCRGIPTGSMPGMATKYAKSESLCYLK